MNELIAFFEYNNEKYTITKTDNNRIIFLKCDKYNNNIKSLSNNEFKLVKKIYNKLLIDNTKSIYIKDVKTENNTYKLYVDSSSQNYFWIPINNKYNEIDNIHLNFKYNHQPEILYTENNIKTETKLSKFYTKFIKIGKKLVPILVSATISLLILNNSIILGQKLNDTSDLINPIETSISETISLEEIETSESTREYNYEEIREAIESNQNIGDKEKEFIYKLKFIFDENNQYMDLDLLIERLKNLKINYDTNLMSATASYNLTENLITSNAENFDSMKKADFLHEFFHVLQKTGNPFIGELSTEFFTRETMIRLYKEGLVEKEFFLSQYAKEEYEKGNIVLNNEEEWFEYLSNNNRFNSGYSDYVNLYYVLAELLPQEALREYQFNPTSIGVLISPLTEIVYSEEKEIDVIEELERAYQLITSINELRVYSEETNSFSYTKDVNNCTELLNYYYKESKGIELKEDPTCCLYLKLENDLNTNITTDIFDYIKENYNILQIESITPKTYLSTNQKNPILVYINNNQETNILEINDKIKEEYKQYVNQIENIENKTR